MALGQIAPFALTPVEAGGASVLATLPVGAAPAPLTFPHFPDRLHAFVWRNWSLVPIERMARVLGAKPADLIRLGRGMGLASPEHISLDQQRRSYITVIKRNWHLLPYDQLLELLGWTAEQLAYTLREDDFLFIKLGNLKPRCEPLRYQAPDGMAPQRQKAIAGILREELGEAAWPGRPSFWFRWTALASHLAGQRKPESVAALRFCYSYFALYGDPLLDAEADPYPDGYLARLGQAGVNGVWLQAVLYKLALFPWKPELSSRYQERLKSLQLLVSRAKRHGIRIFLYLNEPRAMPLSFFEKYPELKGVVETDYAVLCTSHPEVRKYLSESVASICQAVPDLGGFFTITASENLTNCWSHAGGMGCPRCGKRLPPM